MLTYSRLLYKQQYKHENCYFGQRKIDNVMMATQTAKFIPPIYRYFIIELTCKSKFLAKAIDKVGIKREVQNRKYFEIIYSTNKVTFLETKFSLYNFIVSILFRVSTLQKKQNSLNFLGLSHTKIKFCSGPEEIYRWCGGMDTQNIFKIRILKLAEMSFTQQNFLTSP